MKNPHPSHYSRPITAWIILIVSFLLGTHGIADSTQASESITAAEEMTSRGNFEASLPAWREALAESTQKRNLSEELTASIGLADALQELGQNRLAEETLETADGLAKKDGTEKLLQARIESSLGTLYMFASDPEDAEGLLTKSLALARQLKDAHLTATALNNLGNFHAYQKNNDQALEEYEEGVSQAHASGDKVLAIKISANLVMCAVATGSWDEARKSAYQIIEQGPDVPDTHDKAMALLSAGKACVDIFTQSDSKDDDLRLKAYDADQQAEQTARQIHDDRALSYALGYQGELYQMEGKSDEALDLTRHAAILAQQLKSPDILFRWQWQIARILALQHRREPAITAYQSAVATLQTIRHDMSLHFGNDIYHSSFREAAGAVYFELADLLLQRADDAKTDAEMQTDLLAARDTAEDLKAAELEDYFQDDCANLLKSKITKIETVSATAAVIYIIPLADRTEILVNMPSGRIERVKSEATAAQLEETATAFRFNLEKRTTDEYLDQATQLYDWLIKPLAPLIDNSKIDTLVFVPDGALRTIPMAALSDGQHFLVEKYAIATTPGLTLMEPKPLTAQKSNLIINGLSDSVQGFAPLSYVPDEVKKLNSLYGGPELMNAKFIQPNVDKEFASDSYSIVHIASHGHFDSDARKTFVLTYDGKLSLDELERMIRPSQMRDQPVELLTLSACQTAAGDDRAALGLAGIAVKAGARSAFATLWFVNDEASSMIVGDFYTNLHSGISKAKALQQAQIKLLSDPRYGHPCYWAPYLIIGNWL
jgi:CHAT domain-containing protein/Tfp pilus assembly protein PilF